MLFPAWNGNVSNGGLFGRSPNAVAHQSTPLLTHGDYQYAAWYRNGALDEPIILGRRSLLNSDSQWESFSTGLNLIRGDRFDEQRSSSTPTQTVPWDTHNAINLGISGDGRIHLAYDHHSNVLRYIQGDINGSTWNRTGVFGVDTQSAVRGLELDSFNPGDPQLPAVTYPRFATNPITGDLVATYRLGQSGAGDLHIANYDASTGLWSDGREFITGNDGVSFNDFSVTGINNTSTSRNPYLNDITYGPDGSLHASFTWRETANGTANHNINYITSTDGGLTWLNDSGDQVAGIGESVSISSPGIVIGSDTNFVTPFIAGGSTVVGDGPLGLIDRRQTLINQQGQAVDLDGGVHILMWQREDPSTYDPGDFTFDTQEAAHFHHFKDPVTGEWSSNSIPTETDTGFPVEVGSRPKINYDADGNVYATYTSPGIARDSNRNILDPGFLVVAGASKESGYSDWDILYLATDRVYEGEPIVDQQRLLRDGVLSVLIQDTSSVTGVTSSDLRVIDIRVAPEVADGDINGDGYINGADFLAWQRDSGDANQLALWQAAYDANAAAGAISSVPEPASSLLAFAVVVTSLRCRRR